MKLFPWQKRKDFFTPEQSDQLVKAIQEAERMTSGEVRIFVESKCRFVDPVDRAKELFLQLGMAKTKDRNATLIYLAVKDKQAAVLGDEGIHQKVGEVYWNKVITKMIQHFKTDNLVDGLCEGITHLGEALHTYFPYDKETDKNELPDEIVFGR